jgi:DNA-binding response OmpR family regulator
MSEYKNIDGIVPKASVSDTCATIRIGTFWFNQAARKLSNEEQDVALTEKEAAVLAYLYDRAGKPVSRSTLLQELWEDYAPTSKTHTVQTHIYRLRRKLEMDPANAGILDINSSSYCLIAARGEN